VCPASGDYRVGVSAENVDVVERFESLMGARGEGGGGSLDEVLELLDENVAFRPSESVPGHGGEWVGHEGFLQMCRAYGEVWETPKDFRYEVLDGGGDRVVILASFIRTSRRTGRSIPIRMVEIVTVRDGKITELVPYFHDTVPMTEVA
jgi:ketosteroid isomerase-like protein